MNFDYPAIITNIIIDYNENSKHDFDYILREFIIPSKCRHLQLRFYDEISFSNLISIMNLINDSFIKSVEIITKFSKNYDIKCLNDWVTINKKIKSIILHSSEKLEIIKEEDFGFGIIVSIEEEINNETYCGVIHHNYFNTMIESFTECQHHNTCLNKKLSIDVNGNVKNCPSMLEHFRNIKDSSLSEVLNNKYFKKYWNITKDMIVVCKDCEFRHICTDCRAFTKRTHNEDEFDLSKPLKCGYNPYTNEWSEWSTNSLKQKAIDYFSMQE